MSHTRLLHGLLGLSRVVVVTTLLTILLTAGAFGLRGALAGPHALPAATSHSQIQAGGLAVRPNVQCPGIALPC